MRIDADKQASERLFLGRLHRNHAEQFRLLEATIELGDTFISATHGGEGNTDVTHMLYIIFSRMYNNITAASILLKQGYGVESGMLTRGFLEGFFNFCYVTSATENERSTLAARFFAYQWVARYFKLQNIRKAGGQVPNRMFQEVKANWKEHWVNQYGWDEIANQLDWSGIGLSEKAAKGGVTEVYKWLHPHFSELVHGGPDAWQGSVEESADKISFSIGPKDDQYIDFPIPAFAFLFSSVIHRMGELLELPELMNEADKVEVLAKLTFPPKEKRAPRSRRNKSD